MSQSISINTDLPLGLDPVTNNEIAFQLLFSYLPIIIGTVIGPFWIMIAKYIAVVAPLNVMVIKSRSSAQTISSKVSGLPPGLSLPRVLKSRHWRLAAVSVCIILSNILAVMLSSLFQETYVRVPRTTEFIPMPYTDFQNRSINDGYGPFYTVYSQLALNASATSWANEDYYFRPFQLSDYDYPRNNSDRYKATTLGIGADFDCQPIQFEFNSSKPGVRTGAQITGAGSYWTVALNVVNTPNGTLPVNSTTSVPEGVCMSAFGGITTTLLANLTHPQSQLKALHAWPDWTIMEGYNPWGDPSDNCANSFPVVALSAGLSVDAQNSTSLDGLKTQSLLCKSIVKFGNFNVTVTPSGAVQEAVLINSLTEAPNSSTTTSWMKKINSELQIANSFFPDNFGDNQIRYLTRRPFESYAATNWALILASLNTSSQLDTSKWNGTSLPPASAIADELSSIYRKLFVEYLALDANSTLPIMMSLTPNNSSSSISGQSTMTLRRVLVSRTSFIVSAVILGVFLLAIVAVYARPMDKGLPFVPITLGATLAFVHGSEALEDVKGTSGFSTSQREKHLSRLGHRYYIGYGNSGDGDGSDAPRQYGLHKES